MSDSIHVGTTLMPDLADLMYKQDGITLREVMKNHRNDKCIRSMITFVPDELIHEKDLTKKDFRKFNAVMGFVNLSRLFNIYERYISAENGGSNALFALLCNYATVIIEEVYITHGDVLKLSQSGILVMWRVGNEFVSKLVHNVVLWAQRVQEAIANLDKTTIAKIDIVISAGEVIFSIIGDDTSRHFVIGGTPIEDLKYAKRICLPGDLVLSSSAWEHCAPNQYEYVIKDSNNVKIIKVLGPPVERKGSSEPFEEKSLNDSQSDTAPTSGISITSTVFKESDTDVNEPQVEEILGVDAQRENLRLYLKSYMLKPIVAKIESEELLHHLVEVRQVTAICISIAPLEYSLYELISLVDQLYKMIQNIIQKDFGCITMMNLYETAISFYVMYGVRGYSSGKVDENHAKIGLTSALKIMQEIKRISGINLVQIGVSTGVAFCGVIGHAVRKQYVVFGTPVDKSISLMAISFNMVFCDYDTLFNSNLGKEEFYSRGMRVLKKFGKCQVYEYISMVNRADRLRNLEYSYPILGRYDETENFKDILDDIGVEGRTYSGLLLEGCERSGKSRLLDAFVTIVRNRQIRLLCLSLHPSYEDKAYAVLYRIFLKIFDAEDCTTIEDRERILLNNLSEILKVEDFCYLNTIMRVQFPLSEKYCEDSDWVHHKKTVEIFYRILIEVVGCVCILLDDVQHMDLLSWQFLSHAMKNSNVVLAMSILEPVSRDHLSKVEDGIYQSKRLMHRTLQGLDSKYLAAFACQFLNVIAIPKSLEKILQRHSKNMIGWCETFLISILQVQALQTITISPKDVSHYDLVFPSQSLLVKIPVCLTPEELPPPLHWSQMSALNVCIPSTKPTGKVDANRDVTGLKIDIYSRMNSYEQEFIKCAATLGKIFLRSALDSIIPNAVPVYTTKAVAEMVRLRILECAMIQRKHCDLDDSVFFILKKRRTFSNMHHLIICDCQNNRSLFKMPMPTYAYCRVIEFTISSYRTLFYQALDSEEKKNYHMKAVTAYEKDARRCSTCGGGNFLNIISTNDMKSSLSLDATGQKKDTFQTRQNKIDSRRSIFVPDIENKEKRREYANIRKISIMPIHTEADTDGGYQDPINKLNFPFKPLDGDSYSLIAKAWVVYASYSSGGGTIISSSLYELLKRKKRSTEIDAISSDPCLNQLKNFSHIDNRNCRCMDMLSYLFWLLMYHVLNSEDVDALAKFTMEYGAGLILTAQSLYATKFLADATASMDNLKGRKRISFDAQGAITERGRNLILTGDAYTAHGNYAQAKKFYQEALALRMELPQTTTAICYKIMFENVKYKLRSFPEYSIGRDTGDEAARKMEMAVYLHRLSLVLMLEEEVKTVKIIIFHSLRSAFECSGDFYETGQIYLTAVQFFRESGDLNLAHFLAKPMLKIIEQKINWKYPEEIITVARIYQTIYETRILEGKLEESIKIGIKICKISNCMRLNKIKLSVLPSLIEIMVWTMRVNEAVDLLNELYYLAKRDTDYSGLTWYYALCMELLLDASMSLESYKTCYDFYTNVIASRSSACVLRDPTCIIRLVTCLLIWQLRMNFIVNEAFVKEDHVYLKGTTYYNFSQIFNCVKALECYLLILMRRINVKKSSDLFDRLQDATTIVKFLEDASHSARFVKPYLFMLQSYMELLRGRRASSRAYLSRSYKTAIVQGNKLVLALIEQNKRTWKKINYNNMAQYWVEYVGNGDGVRWQEIGSLRLKAWSTILYPLPVPDSTF